MSGLAVPPGLELYFAARLVSVEWSKPPSGTGFDREKFTRCAAGDENILKC
jgi:hypothetical protein